MNEGGWRGKGKRGWEKERRREARKKGRKRDAKMVEGTKRVCQGYKTMVDGARLKHQPKSSSPEFRRGVEASWSERRVQAKQDFEIRLCALFSCMYFCCFIKISRLLMVSCQTMPVDYSKWDKLAASDSEDEEQEKAPQSKRVVKEDEKIVQPKLSAPKVTQRQGLTCSTLLRTWR